MFYLLTTTNGQKFGDSVEDGPFEVQNTEVSGRVVEGQPLGEKPSTSEFIESICN